MKNILLVGESWISNATHFKGWDQFHSTTYHLGAEVLIKSIDENLFKNNFLFSYVSTISDLHGNRDIVPTIRRPEQRITNYLPRPDFLPVYRSQ